MSINNKFLDGENHREKFFDLLLNEVIGTHPSQSNRKLASILKVAIKIKPDQIERIGGRSNIPGSSINRILEPGKFIIPDFFESLDQEQEFHKELHKLST